MTMIDAKLVERAAGWRRHLHAHPELSGQEASTASFVSEQLSALGIEHETGIGNHGIVATIRRPGSNRSVGLRADMDALPIKEANTFQHASRNPGVMHACGHDGHTAALLGTAAALMDDDSWNGTINLVFQPAEENGQGAKAMIADGLFQRFPMERLFAWHNWPDLPAGKVAVHTRPSMAAGGDWRVDLKGLAGHAAMPHLTRDPINAAAHLIVALNTIVSRNVDPLETVALTVSMIQGGTVSNQTPETATIIGTLRTFDAEVRKAIIARMSEVIEGTAAAWGVKADYEINSTGRVMADTPAEAALSVAAAEAVGLPVTRDVRPAMGGDDFAFLVEGKSGAYVLIGNGPAAGDGKLHNERYEFNDEILGPAISWLTQVAKLALRE
ncbi:amidohydrolase [Mesorhizobium sp. B2-7-1]|uniref:amidohydrolase n=1 Tax=Mesorhizobium sp. B2-7-1 TaxID=2589909 RepID=UPI001FEEEE1E|nr:amidohydrolase [Mesorhizobium sp. B2-7-1]